jgi:glycosyltransferase involved in cell wall biosynthesis
MPSADEIPKRMKMLRGSGSHEQLPLVTLVLINWNYAAYVGAAIDSILAQDYPSLEVIVVDNGSTDDSRDIIDRHVGGDRRCRIIHLDSNLGQLGAFFHVFNEIHGNFVTIVDADDLLMSNYVSSHVQVHIALPRAVAFTSSNIYEMDANGRTITGGYYPFASSQEARPRYLPCIDVVPRLATISDCDYRLLAESTSTIPFTQIGWFWGPGTANMYRRSVLDLTQRPERNGSPYRHAADTYLNPFCHGLGGSALIHLPLSAYRVHNRNYFALRESMDGMRHGRPEISAQNALLKTETIEFLLNNAKRYVEIIGGDHFWNLIDVFSDDPRRRGWFHVPQKALVDNFSTLTLLFGERGLCNALIPRMRSSKIRAVLRNAHGGRIPLKLRMTILRKSAKHKILRSRRILASRKKQKAMAATDDGR